MNTIRLGIIGTGTIAQAAHLPNIIKLPEFELVGACARERIRLNAIAEKYSIPVTDTNFESFIQRDDIDAILVSTPTDSHVEIGLAAIEAGKHVLIEKPLARSLQETKTLADAAENAETVFMVGMNHRFRIDLVAMKNMISHDEIGKVYSVNAGWLNHQSTDKLWMRRKDRAGGGVVMDLGLVIIDVLLWILDFPRVLSVSAVTTRNKTTSVEDSASCFLRLDSGISAHVSVSWSAVMEKSDYYLDFFGMEGSAALNPLRIHKTMAGALVNVTPVLQEPVSSIYQRSYAHELRHFAGAIAGSYPAVSTAREALSRMRIIDAVYKSAELNKEIQLTQD